MAATPFAERPTSLKLLGAALVALMLFFVWLTYAFFNKTFVATDDVVVDTGKAGLNLPQSADVKLRGMIVGEVKSIEPRDGGVRLVLGMKPDMIDDVPRDVTAEIIPKTLFGEKYVALIPADDAGPEKLQAGDVIERAEVPIEVESLLNDLYPLLQAVEPAELSYTLTAVSQALEGRGEKLGDTLVAANRYLTALNPDVPTLVDDLTKLGTVSDGYADAMPEVGRFLRNTVITGNTVVAKRTQLAAFFSEGTRLANTLTDFTQANGDNLEALAKQNRVLLNVTAEYSNTFPCFTGGMATVLPKLNSVLRNNTVHLDLELLPQQPTYFGFDENPQIPSDSTLDRTVQADPRSTARTRDGQGRSLPNSIGAVCNDLKVFKANADNPAKWPFNRTNPFAVSPEVFKLIGIKNSHNGKFGTDADFEDDANRAAVSSLDAAGFFNPSLADTDTDAQRAEVRSLAAAVAGVEPSDVPDAASLLLSPILRGTEVSAR
jgi:virulence factor Mce-like protein